MHDVNKVTLVMTDDVLLGVVAKVRQPFVAEPKVVWRPFVLNTNRTLSELSATERRKQAEQAIRNAWGVKP